MSFLGYEDAAAAIESGERSTADDGRVMHAELSFGDDAIVFVSPPNSYISPTRRRELAAELDRMYDNARATRHSAVILRSPEEPGIGARICTVEDPEGHRWMFGRPV